MSNSEKGFEERYKAWLAKVDVVCRGHMFKRDEFIKFLCFVMHNPMIGPSYSDIVGWAEFSKFLEKAEMEL